MKFFPFVALFAHVVLLFDALSRFLPFVVLLFSLEPVAIDPMAIMTLGRLNTYSPL